MKVTVLGCGGSEGVPSATGNWGACDPSNPKNYRRRPAVLIELDDSDGIRRHILIDTPPELREQLVRAGATRIDAVLMTHGHADHLHGFDDLRPFSRLSNGMIPVYGERFVIEEIHHRFGYAVPGNPDAAYRPIASPHIVDGVFRIHGIEIRAFSQDHGFSLSTGYRIGAFAYSIDVVRLPQAAFDMLGGLQLWIVDCQQLEPHPTHSHLAQTLEWRQRLSPIRTVLTHLGPRLDYDALTARLPVGVEAGFDGLVIEIER